MGWCCKLVQQHTNKRTSGCVAASRLLMELVKVKPVPPCHVLWVHLLWAPSLARATLAFQWDCAPPVPPRGADGGLATWLQPFCSMNSLGTAPIFSWGWGGGDLSHLLSIHHLPQAERRKIFCLPGRFLRGLNKYMYKQQAELAGLEREGHLIEQRT